MVEDRIGFRYAKSLFSIAEERKVLEKAREDMELILTIYRDNRDFATFLKSPLISSPKKVQISDKIFAGRFKTEIVDLLVRLIMKKGREMYLPQVAESFLHLYDKEYGIVRGVLTSAVALSDETAAEIKSMMEKETGRSFVMEQEVDPEIIGGFVLNIGDTLFDGSVVNSLRKIKQEFIKNN